MTTTTISRHVGGSTLLLTLFSAVALGMPADNGAGPSQESAPAPNDVV